jgi:hypothetical protein
VHAAATTPVQRLSVIFAQFTQPYQPSPEGVPGRPAHRTFRGLLGVHSRCGLHTRAGHLFVTLLTEGFSHFVSSMTAPVASGWSGWPGGICTHRKTPPWHGAPPIAYLRACVPMRLRRFNKLPLGCKKSTAAGLVSVRSSAPPLPARAVIVRRVAEHRRRR